MRRWTWRVVVVLVVGLALAAGGAWWRLWRPLPVTSGTVRVSGPGGPVEIVRDAAGVPHVRARSDADAFFALGYLHAQDRLWQMEFQRRVARGQLAEILGAEALQADRWFRTLGLAALADDSWQHVSPAGRAIVLAYVRGVNAVVATLSGPSLPVEFALLGITPAPWTPQDCFLWPKVMSLALDTNYRDEMLRARLVARVGLDGAAALMPDYTAGGPVIVPEGLEPGVAPAPSARAGASPPPIRLARTPANDEVVRMATAIGARWAGSTMTEGPPAFPSLDLGGSNNWVISGARSTTGRPILANDPHLGAALPSVWYLAHLQGGRLDVIGATLPGAPGVPIGHNAHIAWGVTNLMADVQDLYIEHVNASNEVEFQGAWLPMRLAHERIRVKGGPDVPMVVRSSRHGPLVSDVLAGPGGALALRWTALEPGDRLLDAQLAIGLARNWEEFTVAAASLRSPMLNYVYADTAGNIGYFAPGRLPIRPHHDGTLPVPGWSGEYEWEGFVPPDRLPRILNPTRGFVVSANNRALPEGDPYPISTNWEPGYRAARITELIEGSARLSPDDMARMQADLRTPQVRILLPWMRRARPADDESRAALERLRTWEGALAGDSPEAAVFVTWLSTLVDALYLDELGPELFTDWAQWPHWRAKALDRLVARADDRWCDDVRTEGRETCEGVLGSSLRAALDRVAAVQGSRDIASWQWNRQNDIAFAHAPLDAVPYLRPVFSRHVAAGGSSTTINPVMPTPRGPVIASYRQIIDLADLDNSRFIHAPGQSGQVLSPHYADLLERWRRVEYLPMAYSPAAVARIATERLVLEPR